MSFVGVSINRIVNLSGGLHRRINLSLPDKPLYTSLAFKEEAYVHQNPAEKICQQEPHEDGQQCRQDIRFFENHWEE